MRHLKTAVHLALTVLIITALVLIAAPAFGQAAHGFEFCWTDPVEREDGTPLDPDTELAAYTLQIALANGFDDALVSIVVARRDTTEDGARRCYFWHDAVQQGGWYDTRMTAIDTGELESDWSEVVTVRKQARPRPPGRR